MFIFQKIFFSDFKINTVFFKSEHFPLRMFKIKEIGEIAPAKRLDSKNVTIT